MTQIYRELGAQGEELVAHYLEQHGYTILAKNYTRKTGEIDIIARNKLTIAFVEVKLRRYHYLSLSEIITPSKQRKITATALLYLAEQGNLHDTIIRFDAALLEFNGYDYTINYYENAFTHQGSW